MTMHRSRALVMAFVALTMLVVPSSGASAAETERTVEFTGGGWGHGRGMSQYGAQGYASGAATGSAWTSTQILDHYYGGTVSGAIPATGTPDPNELRVNLVAMSDQTAIMKADSGQLEVRAADGTLLGSAGIIRIYADGDDQVVEAINTWPCAGEGAPTSVTEFFRGPSARVETRLVGGDAGRSGLISTCRPDGSVRWYPGRIDVYNVGDSSRSVNVIAVDDYLRGVVPNESIPSWTAAALEAQAVAARSYVMAGDPRWVANGITFADTCDTTRCQVFNGWYSTTSAQSGGAETWPTTDAAIATTTGLVRLFGDGTVARTEFHSTSGGHTAGGDFPAVEDLGDSISPLHTWSVTLPTASVEASFGLGQLDRIEILTTDGNGADGGRVLTARLHFDNGVADRTGDQIRTLFGLRSNWFRPGVVVGSIDQQNRAFVARTADVFGQSDVDVAAELAQLDAAGREAVTLEWALADGFVGTRLDVLYQNVFERPADDGGRTYWQGVIADGLTFNQVGTWFYSSEEYFNSAGRDDRRFIEAMYDDILGRPADDAGVTYWLEQRSAGAGRDDIAFAFYESIESRRDRATDAAQLTLGRAPSASERDTWAGRIATDGDLRVIAWLAASEEAFALAQSTHG